MRFGGGADHRFVPCADAAPGQAVPASRISQPYSEAALERSIFHRNFGLPGATGGAHIVRPDAEEEACLDPMPAQQLQQPRNAVRVPRKVSTSMRKPTCSWIFIVHQFNRAQKEVQRVFDRFFHLHLRLPVQAAFGVADARLTMLNVLVALSVVIAAFHFTEAGERRKRSRSG